MKFIIDRSKWRCGWSSEHQHGEGPTRLLNSAGFQCCLGFTSEQEGIPRDELRDGPLPESIADHCKRCPISSDPEIQSRAVEINDSNLPDLIREGRLVELFAEHGHEIAFVGEYAK